MALEKSLVRWLYILFFLSGFPALLYQIVWQRALLSIYGTNIESVTVVVSGFMLGLGLGSLAGGFLSRYQNRLLTIFALTEMSVAAFGVVSLRLFHWAAAFTVGASVLETGLVSFALVLIPTVLMGATLPVLVTHVFRFSGNVGRSVGILYFVNTLGSAAACFAAAEFTMHQLGLSGSVTLAACINSVVCIAILSMHFFPAASRTPVNASRVAKHDQGLLPLPLGLILSAIAGFISLCYEIIWYRLYSFITGGSPKSFAFMLGSFLAGIALGSLLARTICVDSSIENRVRVLRRIGALVLLANLLGFLSVPLIAAAVRHANYVATLPLVAVASGAMGAVFPLLSHIAVPASSRVGPGLSWLYLANIIGSALGSFLVGFVLMDVWGLRTISLTLAIAGLCVSLAISLGGFTSRLGRLATAAMTAALCAVCITGSRPLFAEIYEQLQYKSAYRAGTSFTDIVENRSGVITVDSEGTVYGGGAFDGKLITDITETNTVLRPYAISFFHPDPKNVLIIGLAAGAWTEVIVNHPQVEHVTVIEINPGYLGVIRRYPEVAPILSNTKIDWFVDDGRRWLMRSPDRRFDLIVMDTTYYWRDNATNLLSREFLNIIRKHLKPGGVLYYNGTHSCDVEHTGVTSFPYASRFGPLLAVSDSPLLMDKHRWRNVLEQYQLEGQPVFDLSDKDDRARLDQVVAYADTLHAERYDPSAMEDGANIRRRTHGCRIITDDNMASEWTQ